MRRRRLEGRGTRPPLSSSPLSEPFSLSFFFFFFSFSSPSPLLRSTVSTMHNHLQPATTAGGRVGTRLRPGEEKREEWEERRRSGRRHSLLLLLLLLLLGLVRRRHLRHHSTHGACGGGAEPPISALTPRSNPAFQLCSPSTQPASHEWGDINRARERWRRRRPASVSLGHFALLIPRHDASELPNLFWGRHRNRRRWLRQRMRARGEAAARAPAAVLAWPKLASVGGCVIMYLTKRSSESKSVLCPPPHPPAAPQLRHEGERNTSGMHQPYTQTVFDRGWWWGEAMPSAKRSTPHIC